MGGSGRSVIQFASTNDAARTVKSRGPGTPKLVSRVTRASALRARWPTSRRTGENAKQPSKPSRREGRVCSAGPVVPAACISFCRRATGAASARPSLRPSSREGGTMSKARTQNASRDRGAASPDVGRQCCHERHRGRRCAPRNDGVRGKLPTLPWRGRVASRRAKRDVRRGGVISPLAPEPAERSPHPARPLRVRSTLPLQGRVGQIEF